MDDNEDEWIKKTVKNNIILKKIGKGTYCRVYFVYNIDDMKCYALKIYNEEDNDQAIIEKNIIDKIQKLKIENCIKYYDFFTYSYNKKKYNMHLMELCGYSMNDLIKIFTDDLFQNLKNNDENKLLYSKYINFLYNGVIDLLKTLDILKNNNYSHTDIKPENILISIINYENSLLIKKINYIHMELKNKNKNLKTELQKEIFKLDLLNNQSNLSNLSNLLNSHIIKNYLKDFNFKIKLCDLGTTLKFNDDTIYVKHTQYYKSPKIMLGYKLDSTYDYWSIGCTLYEILTNEILFDPYNIDNTEYENYNEDRNLMYLICNTLGIPKKEYLQNSKNSDVYFTSDYKLLRGYKHIKNNLFIEKLLKNYDIINNNITKNQYIYLVKLVIEYINYDYLFKKN